ncbi:MAG TPA: DUF3943 domain-containing protein [Candidatus Tectomicrobia bacterium]|nr:DUF3943 domain-containing protein [Candidatus Tectomicrobia bacterium]
MRVRCVKLVGALMLALATPSVGLAQDSASRRLDRETGEHRSFLVPALEIPGFILGLNVFNRLALDSDDYDSDRESIEKNFTTAPRFDRDPFSINQLGHPYQGSIYHGAARSTGLSYWESLLYTLGGSFVWETAGETTRPSLNDHVTTGIGGTFVGEALFRMASLVLEGGGERPGVWREMAAALVSPPTGFNRLMFGDRFDAVLPSRDPAVFLRLRVAGVLTTSVRDEARSVDVDTHEGSADFSIAYGLPGKPGYRYRRPFDYFLFDLTAVPSASSVQDAVENVAIRGLLLGDAYGWGDDYRAVWGLFGGFDYLSPQAFRLSSTALSLGTVGQWWLSRAVALQGTALGGVGFGAAGTVGDRDEQDYHYGVMPQSLVGLRLIVGDVAMLEASGRHYFVIGEGRGSEVRDPVGLDLINRATVGITVRLFGPHAIGLHYVLSAREARFEGLPDRNQSVQTISLSYTFLGQRGFGAVEWRPAMER